MNTKMKKDKVFKITESKVYTFIILISKATCTPKTAQIYILAYGVQEWVILRPCHYCVLLNLLIFVNLASEKCSTVV